ncbi:class I SAM-dependent methyltransferase [Leifsonia shinshuensis]|uniref:class I SAM-dependent methyltransferase n=1 Tax=Leifsonia shinshuensis TaxID=150026 RepID=UPI00286254C1|nr:class I SAM-dependent methyltransferase [Leifsonia shinshuensis]MDR6971077.1 SAM-dependent methyltransferase [Leifsonia shinshuensis]
MRSRHQRDLHAASFDRAADVYDAARPSYPADAESWLTEGIEGPVLDLGAGTGKLTAALVARGFEVSAVDPSPEMLRVLGERLPDVDAREGSAERIPFPDSAFGLVLVAQAWHWVDAERAIPEVARVLRPGGRLGLIWNERDESVGWVRELGELMDAGSYAFDDEGDPVLTEPFGRLEKHETGWVQALSHDGLLDLARSRSYFITKDADGQAAVIQSLRRLLREHPDLAGRDTIELPYVTRSYRAAREG